MLANDNLWIKASHGYFEKKDPAVHGVKESKVDLAKYPYDINGKNSGFISMNGLIVASALAMGRGSFHYSLNDALTENGDRVLWAEYAPEKVNGKKTCVYLMKIRIREVTGINYGYSRIPSAEILKYDASSNNFEPALTEEELSLAEYAPPLCLIPVLIASCALNPEVEKRVNSLSHLPENKYDENPNLYWLCHHFFSSRSEYYSTPASLTPLPEDEVQLFVSKYLENLVGWDFKDMYNSRFHMTFGDISYDRLAAVFSGEVDPDSELSQLVPKVNLEDYYIDPKIKGIVDLLVMEKDSNFPINTGMLYGPPASGKSTAVMLMARMLNLPYVPVTFNSNISMDDLLGSWQPTEDGKISLRGKHLCAGVPVPFRGGIRRMLLRQAGRLRRPEHRSRRDGTDHPSKRQNHLPPPVLFYRGHHERRRKRKRIPGRKRTGCLLRPAFRRFQRVSRLFPGRRLRRYDQRKIRLYGYG